MARPPASRRAPPTGAHANAKLAQTLAHDISREIVRKGWRVGAPLGNEADLVEKHGASRWAVREALSLLERDGLIEIRRGRAGGVYVAEPAPTVVSALIRNYLEFARVSVADIIATRAALEELAMTTAAARMSAEDAAVLRQLLKDIKDAEDADATSLGFKMLSAVYRATYNPVLKIFLDSLAQFTIGAGLRSNMTDAEYFNALHGLLRARSAQVKAILAGDAAAIQASLKQHLQSTAKMLEALQRPASGKSLAHARQRALAVAPAIARGKRADALAQQIELEIASNAWPLGHHLGSEAELLERYKVSRSVFREAVRILEQNGAVEMRRGRHSGLKVSAPRSDLVVARAQSYLHFAKARPDDIASVQAALDRTASALIAERSDADAVGASLSARIDRSGTPTDWDGEVTGFYKDAIAACPNVVLRLMLQILADMAPIAPLPKGEPGRRVRAHIGALQQEFADAISARDAPGARRAAARLREALRDPTRAI
ncbi:MAG: FadR/GntR family transcriptional regulator [Hyphomonadaceae bacterium]